MTSMEALKSTDPRAVKYARRAVKGQVTMGATRLTNLLQKTTDGKFDFDNISYPIVSEVYTKLMSDFELINQLHDRYVQVRAEGQDDDEENRLVDEEVRYMLDVSTQMYAVLEVYMKYEKSFKKQEKMQEKDANRKQVISRKIALSSAKEALNLSVKTVKNDVVNPIEAKNLSPEEFAESLLVLSQPAESLKSTLKADYDELVLKANQLEEALKTGNKDDVETKPQVEIATEAAQYRTVFTFLEKISKVKR